jgi:hypothetical protein
MICESYDIDDDKNKLKSLYHVFISRSVEVTKDLLRKMLLGFA